MTKTEIKMGVLKVAKKALREVRERIQGLEKLVIKLEGEQKKPRKKRQKAH